MGLLEQILGGVAGGMGVNQNSRNSGMGSGVLMALLPVVIGMLSHRGSGVGAAGGLGGLGGLGNGLGMGMGSASVNNAGGLGGLEGAGGLGGLGTLIEQFTHKGYGAQANSWIHSGPNEALSPQAVSDVFGDDRLSQIAQQAGVSTEDARHGLSELLPNMVDHFTPQGQVPSFEHMSSSVDDFVSQMNSRSRQP